MVKTQKLPEYLNELEQTIADPTNKRILQAYKGEDPKKNLENELGRILSEVINSEDK